MTFVSIACVVLAGCAAIERNYHGDRVNERVLAELRAHTKLEVSVQPATIHAGEPVTVMTSLHYDGATPADICTEAGVSTWIESPDGKKILPLHLVGITTDVKCSRSVHLTAGTVESASQVMKLPRLLGDDIRVCAGMGFEYCGVDYFPCAISNLRAECVPVTVER